MPPKKKVKTTHTAAKGNAKTASLPATGAGAQAATTVARRNVRVKRGGLESMPHMPLDVLIEVRAPYGEDCDERLNTACRFSAFFNQGIFSASLGRTKPSGTS